MHGRLESGQRVIVHGAAGGVGHLAVQLAARRAAYVIGTTSSSAGADMVRSMGANQVIDSARLRTRHRSGGPGLRHGGRRHARAVLAAVASGWPAVTIADEPPEGVDATYFVVEPDGEQLAKVATWSTREPSPSDRLGLPPRGVPRSLREDMASGKRGKVVLRVIG